MEPEFCGALLKDLASLGSKDDSLGHLKRVKRVQWKKDRSQHTTKKAKMSLEVILGRSKEGLTEVIEQYKLNPKVTVVPGRSAESQRELEEFNSIWPTVYFQKKTEEHKEQELALTEGDVQQMRIGMIAALADGAVIMNPDSGEVVVKSQDEKILHSQAPVLNPLCTPAILAIQGVCRLERRVAINKGMDSHDFRGGQYLCSGYDVYMRREPSIFEAMALLHSRVRRVIFAERNTCDGGLGGSGAFSMVHCLPGTNHHYRVFTCTKYFFEEHPLESIEGHAE